MGQLLEFTQCIPLFFLSDFIHNILIASLLLFIKDPLCFCFISGAKVVRVLEQKQGRGLSGLGKKSPPMRVVFFARALLLPDTHLFMLMKQKHSILRLFRRIKKNVRNEN
jgi:hypothetical protein